MAVPHPEIVRHGAGDAAQPALVWRLRSPLLAIASAPLGGGLGIRRWLVNAQVRLDYGRTDPAEHLGEIAGALGCSDDGIGMLTATAVERYAYACDAGVDVFATVGLSEPTWAAAADADATAHLWAPGTVNVVAFLPVRLSDAALVNAVMTVTEAKAQALAHAGVPGTGTASDAVCVLCPADGTAEPFGGPRSAVGAPLARVAHAAIAARCKGPS